VTARQSLLDVGLVSLGVHREPVSSANPCRSQKIQSQKAGFSFAFASAVAVGLRRMISWRGVAKKRRRQELAVLTVKSWRTVASTQQSWRNGNHLPPNSVAVRSRHRLHEDPPRRQPSTVSRRSVPEVWIECRPSRKMRAQGMPGARCTRSPCAVGRKHTVVTTGSPESPGIPCAMVLTAYCALFPATNSFCHRHPRIKTCPSPVGPTHLRGLNISNGCQNHTPSPYAATSPNASTGHVQPAEVLAKALKRRSSARRRIAHR
jgi:hypothetical protein